MVGISPLGTTVILPYTGVLTVVLSILLMFGLYMLVMRTRLGRSMRAVAENKQVAALMGIDVDGVISRTFIISGALAGAAGVMWVFISACLLLRWFPAWHQSFHRRGIGRHWQHPWRHVGRPVLGLVESLGPGILGMSYQLADVIAFAS